MSRQNVGRVGATVAMALESRLLTTGMATASDTVSLGSRGV
jgi:hypothetical protein